jgi:hypothetical protein
MTGIPVFFYWRGLESIRMTLNPAGPKISIKIAGNMKKTSGKINLITVFRAASSAA